MRKLSVIAAVSICALAGLLGHGCSETGIRPRNDEVRLERGVAYQPRGWVPGTDGPVTPADLRRDLAQLHETGFRSLVTYGAADGLDLVPAIAREIGFDGIVVMGVWDPNSGAELDAAVAAVDSVDAYCVGNEGLGSRYTPQELATAMARLRERTGRPVTTAERIRDYFAGPWCAFLHENSDWLLPVAQPHWRNEREPESAVKWVVLRYDHLLATSDRPVMLKEAGVPSAGAPLVSGERQREFFRLLSERGIRFFFFEAYDQPWKARAQNHEEEGHWGLFTAEGEAKPAAAWLREIWGGR